MQHIATAADFTRVFSVSRETIGRLELYCDLLKAWQKAINLVSPTTLGDVWHRHFADSAQLLALAPAKPTLHWVDFGSGAGFPGLVIAIMLAERPGSRVTLIESDAKKCAFLREVTRKTGILGSVAVDIVMERIETAAVSSKVGAVDVISGRALAPLSQLLAYAEPIFAENAVGLFPKGRDAAAEVAAAEAKWLFASELVPSMTDSEAAVVVVRSLRRRVSD